MINPEKALTEKESLDLITSMIKSAKASHHDTGVSAILWGSVITICSLVSLAQVQFNFRLPFNIYWLTFIAVVPQIIFSIRQKKNRQVRSHNDIVMDYLWLAFGICIFLLVNANQGIYNDLKHASGYAGLTGNNDITNQFGNSVLPYFLILYGFPTFVTGAIMHFKPMIWGGIFCWVCSVICVYTPVKIDLLMVAASACFAWLVPGIILQQRYQRAKKKLVPTNV